MGLATLSEMTVFLLIPAYPGPRCVVSSIVWSGSDLARRFVYLAWGIWWIVAGLSIIIDIFLPYMM